MGRAVVAWCRVTNDAAARAGRTRAFRPFRATARAVAATAPLGLDLGMPRHSAPLALMLGREFLPISEDFPCKTAPKEQVHPERSEGPRQPGARQRGDAKTPRSNVPLREVRGEVKRWLAAMSPCEPLSPLSRDFACVSPVSGSMQRAKSWRRGAVEHRMCLR